MDIVLSIPSDPGAAIVSQSDILQRVQALGVRVQPRRAEARASAGHHDLATTLIDLANSGAGAAVVGGIFGLFNVVVAELFRRRDAKDQAPQVIVLKVDGNAHELDLKAGEAATQAALAALQSKYEGSPPQ